MPDSVKDSMRDSTRPVTKHIILPRFKFGQCDAYDGKYTTYVGPCSIRGELLEPWRGGLPHQAVAWTVTVRKYVQAKQTWQTCVRSDKSMALVVEPSKKKTNTAADASPPHRGSRVWCTFKRT